MKQPNGVSKERASRSCRDLFLDHPELQSGIYYIDPNLGCADDAMQVYCDKTTKETCFNATTTRVNNATWYTGKTKRVQFGDMRGGSKFSYVDEVSQLIFLRLLSVEASQKVIFSCKNVDANLEFISSKDEIIRDYTEIENTCQSSGDRWGKAVISYRTDITDNLPFVDFSVNNLGADNQEFGLEMGQVCFA